MLSFNKMAQTSKLSVGISILNNVLNKFLLLFYLLFIIKVPPPTGVESELTELAMCAYYCPVC